ncbi:MAG: hypothetical protein PHO62_07535 [Sulfurimonas sp.]|uniref:hypothetical protein n=1 Tax=Sulfurimonas sp. TaxID=2022749 RepID=UPI00263129FE|nr:hypothetical protein [Sulfurimonas sp.]MDD5373257.1 hypothetical protein [Sulfurimonas sp.]
MRNYKDLPEYVKNALSQEVCEEIAITDGIFIELAQQFKVSINIIKEIKFNEPTTDDLRTKIRLKVGNLPRTIENHSALSIEQLSHVLKKLDEITDYIIKTEAY